LEIRWGRLQLDIQYSTPSEKTMFMSNCVRTIPHAGVGRMYIASIFYYTRCTGICSQIMTPERAHVDYSVNNLWFLFDGNGWPSLSASLHKCSVINT
jgi:hypothetical protein